MPIARKKKPPKYGNKKTVIDGIKFDSKREADRYLLLRAREKAGEIQGLRLQVPFEIAPAVVLDGRKKPARKYIADFVYTKDGRQVVEDSKGMRTEAYRLKRHMMRATHGIEVLEV